MNGQSPDHDNVLADEALHDLTSRHRELDSRLTELAAKHYLSDDEQLEEVRLKKHKLQLKDQMEDLLRRRDQPFTAQASAPPRG